MALGIYYSDSIVISLYKKLLGKPELIVHRADSRFPRSIPLSRVLSHETCYFYTLCLGNLAPAYLCHMGCYNKPEWRLVFMRESDQVFRESGYPYPEGASGSHHV